VRHILFDGTSFKRRQFLADAAAAKYMPHMTRPVAILLGLLRSLRGAVAVAEAEMPTEAHQYDPAWRGVASANGTGMVVRCISEVKRRRCARRPCARPGRKPAAATTPVDRRKRRSRQRCPPRPRRKRSPTRTPSPSQPPWSPKADAAPTSWSPRQGRRKDVGSGKLGAPKDTSYPACVQKTAA